MLQQYFKNTPIILQQYFFHTYSNLTTAVSFAFAWIPVINCRFFASPGAEIMHTVTSRYPAALIFFRSKRIISFLYLLPLLDQIGEPVALHIDRVQPDMKQDFHAVCKP